MTWRRSTTERIYAGQPTAQQLLQEIKTFFDDCSAEGADFPWTVASFAWDTPTAGIGYVVLKRKSGAAGRVYIGCTPSANQSAAYLASMQTTAVSVSIGYDRSATVDTPTQTAAVGAPFGGAIYATWLGGVHIATGTLPLTNYHMRAYTKTDADALVFQMIFRDDSVSIFGVGNLLVNLHTGQPQLFQFATQGMRSGMSAIINSTGNIEDCIIQPRVGQASTNNNQNSGARSVTWDATNLWQRIYRVTAINFDASGALDIATYNTIFTQTDGTRYFLPMYCVGHANNSGYRQKLFRVRFIGIGECRTRLTSQLLDNGSVERGWYLGYHQTQNSDRSGISLLHSDFA